MSRAVGLLVDAGPLGEVLLHDLPLRDHAARALRGAGVPPAPTDQPWAAVVTGDDPPRALVVHDPACPLTPATFIRAMVVRAVVEDRVQVGCRPVTDTIKTVAEGRVGGTVDRDSLFTVTAPVVLPVSVVDDWPDPSDLAALVRRLRLVHFMPAPPLGRRVEDESAVLLLEAFEELHPA